MTTAVDKKMIDMIKKIGITVNQILVELLSEKEDLQIQGEQIQNLQQKMEIQRQQIYLPRQQIVVQQQDIIQLKEIESERLKEDSVRFNDRLENYPKKIDKSYNLAMTSIVIATLSSVVSMIFL